MRAADAAGLLYRSLPQPWRAKCAWAPVPARLRAIAFGDRWYERAYSERRLTLAPAAFDVWIARPIVRAAVERNLAWWRTHARTSAIVGRSEAVLHALQACVAFDLPDEHAEWLVLALTLPCARHAVFRSLCFHCF